MYRKIIDMSVFRELSCRGRISSESLEETAYKCIVLYCAYPSYLVFYPLHFSKNESQWLIMRYCQPHAFVWSKVNTFFVLLKLHSRPRDYRPIVKYIVDILFKKIADLFIKFLVLINDFLKLFFRYTYGMTTAAERWYYNKLHVYYETEFPRVYVAATSSPSPCKTE